jgi:pyruvate,water dikinase
MLIGFDDPQATDVARVGGKAASLGRLCHAGFPVSPGFTVSTGAQASFFAVHGLEVSVGNLFNGRLR